ncbi:MAG: hypothetical protein EZS28_045079 [Streblomastix strix]|uniref:Uncharacterized protein n=1 Tax=Streblomastix strix TaxID=222440 RepID=A0A5J4TLV7_9EUKA|nr:MAG: hypothetical protein EZS28_045079 [Streblomastix strix]
MNSVKDLYSIKNQSSERYCSRFGFIADGDEILNNISIPERDFRAITYDEKEGIIRFGWHEVFRWIPTKDEYRITFDVDL